MLYYGSSDKTNRIATNSFRLTALDASSGVENATNPDPLLTPFGSRIICSIGEKNLIAQELQHKKRFD